MNGHKTNLTVLAFGFQENLLASGGNDGSIKIWNIDTEDITHNLIYSPKNLNLVGKKISSLDFSYNNLKLVSINCDGVIIIWQVESSQPERILYEKLKKPIYQMVNFICKSQILVATTDKNEIEVIKLTQRLCERSIDIEQFNMDGSIKSMSEELSILNNGNIWFFIFFKIFQISTFINKL